METVGDLIESGKQARRKPGEQEMRSLPYLNAEIYGRVSSPNQVRDSRESILEIARLLELAINDGYKTSLDPIEIRRKLEMVRTDPSAEKMWSDGQVTIDVRDLGISGQLSYKDREGLDEMQKRIKDGNVGGVYLTEGVNRLSRDRDRILPFQLLKLMKEHNVRIRTLDGVWNPAIERDNDYLADEFEDAIGERRVMGRRMFRRKAQRAGRGEYVGEPIPPGYMLPITGQKPTGQYEYGRMEPYEPHAAVVRRVLEEFVTQGGSYLRTIRNLNGPTFPLFPPELKYMERLTSLRTCKRNDGGYRISSSLIKSLANNLKLIGVWQWGDTEPISGNHPPIISESLFLKVHQLASSRDKARGRAAAFEPMEWASLLKCMNHDEPRTVSGISSKARYMCNKGYLLYGERSCLDIAGRYFDEPLTDAVLKHLELSPFIEDILERMEKDSASSLEETQLKRDTVRLAKEIEKFQSLLTSCVDDVTGEVDKEKEQYYWEKIRQNSRQIDEINARPSQPPRQPVDYTRVKVFLKNLPTKWKSYPLRMRNRVLKLIIDKVEIRGHYEIEATIFWKAGFVQKVLVHRPPSNSKMDKRWKQDEESLLKIKFKSSSEDDLLSAFPGRSLKSIQLKAGRLTLTRARKTVNRKVWSCEDDEKLMSYYSGGMDIDEISGKLGRGVSSVRKRLRINGLNNLSQRGKRKFTWEASNLITSKESSSRRG